ncbi:hypothetical protein MKY20_28500 [Cytobacillus sp. FSL W8-0315]|uniref:hypothetical protein n=1 Tax=Cytobacillus sp. FSL W8-0315 TaxID=2921600 RepID=UPI0030FAB5AC
MNDQLFEEKGLLTQKIPIQQNSAAAFKHLGPTRIVNADSNCFLSNYFGKTSILSSTKKQQ